MFMPMANTAETLALNECGLQLYVKVDGVPTKKNVLWRKFVDINKIEGELKEINWLYVDVQRNQHHARKGDRQYAAGIQAYTVRTFKHQSR